MSDESIVITLPDGATPETVERVRAAFPDAAFAEPGPAVSSVESVDQLAEDAIAAAPALPERLAELWAAMGGAGSLLLIMLALVIGYAAERAVRAVLLDRLVPPAAAEAPSFAQRLVGAARWTLVRALGLAVFAFTAWLAGRAMLGGQPEGPVALGALGAILFGRGVALFFAALSAPGAPDRRPMGFTDAEARRVAAIGRAVATVIALSSVGRVVVEAAVATPDEGALARIALALLLGGAIILGFAAVHSPLSALGRRQAIAGWRGALARNAALLFIPIVFIDMAVKAGGALGLFGSGAISGAGPSILLLIAAPLAVSALRGLAAELPDARRTPVTLGGFALAESAVVIVTALLLLAAWGVDPFAPPAGGGLAAAIPAVIEAVSVIVVGLALWRSVKAVLKHKGGDVGLPSGDAEMGGEGDRMATVIPILRGAALAVIGITTAITSLSALGVNVAPLLASAGVVGLAIGFGAQSLVTDVISGLFYVYEDAFRVGEFLETESGKGTVERISLRSATLRHSRGAVITVPFSKMGTIQNHSRDWVVMKFTFAVPPETDVEMVRKLIKRVGQEMAAEPEMEGKLLAPLKSQGAIGIAGRNYDIGCKFMARPGEQFAIRRKAFAMLQKALKEHGVELAAPEFNPAMQMRPPMATQ